MQTLTLFYDAGCGVCSAFKKWLERQPAWIDLRFVPLQEAAAHPLAKCVQDLDLERELHVIADTGELYRGDRAWIMCLYALKAYRPLSRRLAHPALRPLARNICAAVSANRLKLSALLALKSDRELAGFAALTEPECATECRLP